MKSALVTGAGGFIGGHLIKRFLHEGLYDQVYAVDIKHKEQWWQLHLTDQVQNIDHQDAGFLPADLVHEVDDVYHLAENMGGIGFIETHLVDCANSITTTINLLNQCTMMQRVFFSSSACVYPQALQTVENAMQLREDLAWPAQPEAGYGLQKLYAEELCKYHTIERGLKVIVARFHNSYGPYGSWADGREKAPAALCRKIALASLTGQRSIKIWGDGRQTRSFMYVDDNVEGIIRLMNLGPPIIGVSSLAAGPVNLGTEELVTITDLADIIQSVAGHHVSYEFEPFKPQGVRGRNSDNSLLRRFLDWEPSTPLHAGLEVTYRWIFDQVKREYGD